VRFRWLIVEAVGSDRVARSIKRVPFLLSDLSRRMLLKFMVWGPNLAPLCEALLVWFQALVLSPS
jgi:hypothetical protein